MKLYFCFFVFSLSALFNGLWAQDQPSCGLRWLEEASVQAGLPVKAIKAGFRNKVDSARFSGMGDFSWREDMTIPVVVHIVWMAQEENLSDDRVVSQLEILNQDFNAENEDIKYVPEEFQALVPKTGIRFCLAAEDPDGHPTDGITRHRTTIESIGIKEELYAIAPAWDTDRYLNVWVANTGDFLTGYGTYPGLVPPERQGAVVHPKYFGNNRSKRFNLGRVAVHEVGHYLGLEHIWGSDETCETDDGVEDTPPQQHPYKNCPAHPQVTCGSANMFMNFMDYVDDDCMLMFTQGQQNRMKATLELFRPNLGLDKISCIQPSSRASISTFSVYPNPTSGLFSLSFKAKTQKVGTVMVLNSLGQKIFQEDTILYEGMQIKPPTLVTGVYTVWIEGKTARLVVRN